MEKKLEILVKELEKKDGTGTFLAYKVYTKKGKMDLRFTKDVKELPTKNGFIYVLEENMNVNQNSRYPELWVTKIERFEDYPERNNKLEDYFD